MLYDYILYRRVLSNAPISAQPIKKYVKSITYGSKYYYAWLK